MRVGGSTLALVSEEESTVEAFQRALSTTVARGSAKLAEVDPASP
jgi:hypothetical protein